LVLLGFRKDFFFLNMIIPATILFGLAINLLSKVDQEECIVDRGSRFSEYLNSEEYQQATTVKR